MAPAVKKAHELVVIGHTMDADEEVQPAGRIPAAPLVAP